MSIFTKQKGLGVRGAVWARWLALLFAGWRCGGGWLGLHFGDVGERSCWVQGAVVVPCVWLAVLYWQATVGLCLR